MTSSLGATGVDTFDPPTVPRQRPVWGAVPGGALKVSKGQLGVPRNRGRQGVQEPRPGAPRAVAIHSRDKSSSICYDEDFSHPSQDSDHDMMLGPFGGVVSDPGDVNNSVTPKRDRKLLRAKPYKLSSGMRSRAE